MAGFKFDEVDQFVQGNDNKINFLKLQDDGWYAKVRFMYGPGESFEGQTVHNVSNDPKKPRYVPCLRGINQPLETCPLCANGSRVNAQFFMPVYVHSIVSNVRGVENEQPVNQVMLFQRGTTFKGCIGQVIRQTMATGKPIVSSMFRLTRSGKAGDQGTQYLIEVMGTDDTTLEQLPPRPEILGSYILPKVDYQTMQEKYVNGNGVTTAAPAQNTTMNSGIQPRTINASTFGNNTIVSGTSTNNGFQPINTNQAPVQAPNIGNVPF